VSSIHGERAYPLLGGVAAFGLRRLARRPGLFVARPALGELGVGTLEVTDDCGHRLELLGFLVGDADRIVVLAVEAVLDLHDDLDAVERVGAKLLLEMIGVTDLVRLQAELLGDDEPYPFCEQFVHRAPILSWLGPARYSHICIVESIKKPLPLLWLRLERLEVAQSFLCDVFVRVDSGVLRNPEPDSPTHADGENRNHVSDEIAVVFAVDYAQRRLRQQLPTSVRHDCVHYFHEKVTKRRQHLTSLRMWDNMYPSEQLA
jgi:hypothetical protein